MLACGFEIRMQLNLTEEERAALFVLQKLRINVLDAALLAKEAAELTHGNLKKARKCLQLGSEQLRLQTRTVTFRKAVGTALQVRSTRRARTLIDFRYICNRIFKMNPKLKQRRIRAFTTEDCRRLLEDTFDSPSQFRKARAILCGVFSTAVRRGWCDTNPVLSVDIPHIHEQQINILTTAEITTLLQTARSYACGACLPAVGAMLYAGIRPHEIIRLTWQDIDLDHGYIYIMPQHSKTGGARRVSIHPPLHKLLEDFQPQQKTASVCPANWTKHWRQLRRTAGWGTKERPWPKDVLRHTFASYHLAYFRSYSALQWEIGHRSSTLLRTRYVNMKGVENAADFWQLPPLPHSRITIFSADPADFAAENS